MTHPLIDLTRARLATALADGSIGTLDDALWQRWKINIPTSVLSAATGLTQAEVARRRWGEADARTPERVETWRPETATWPLIAITAIEEYDRLAADPVHPVVAVYRDDLGREPDAEGLAYWIGEMERRPMADVRRDMLIEARRQTEGN
jgi:hypothetical protein